jgi:hypothetical protein
MLMPEPPDQASTYRMLGRSIRVEYDTSPGAAVLREELSRYPSASEAADLIVRFRPLVRSRGALVNPRSHDEFDGGFLLRERTADVRFGFTGSRLTEVAFYPASSSSVLIAHARRMVDMQYSSREERAGVLFHELVLVPAAYWMPDVALVHASAVAGEDGRVTLIGGTGGVGKTSLALELCLRRGFTFLADDISFVGSEGHVWPNLAYPKIYAYNLEDDADLAARLMRGRGLPDRIHWAVHRRRGAHFVRRRVAPDILYGSFDANGGPLHRYVILAREERSSIGVSDVDPGLAASMSASIMAAEYHAFHNHLYWHAFNRAVAGDEPSVLVQEAIARWIEVLGRVLEGVDCRIVRVPLSIDHQTFKRELAGLLHTPT